MGTGIVITVAEKVIAQLCSQELKEIFSMFGYKSQLDDLNNTIVTIKSVLLEAEHKHQELTHAGRDYIERLKDAVYDVDDLLDEFNTMVQKEKNKMGGKVSKKVRRFFSRSNQFFVGYNMFYEIKNLRGKLDKIAKDRLQFGFSDVYLPIKKREETMSFASEDNIIGRETDKEAVVGMLTGDLESSTAIDYVPIVGIGGLGKTALAQLVYNDYRIEKAFDLRMWVCVSNDFGLDKIFRQILGKDGSDIEELQKEVRKLIQGKRYLLILDDVWSESRDKWDNLKSFLNLGGIGSRIVVTSRSKKVARVVRDDLMYELEGLSEENSWNLFKRLAFKQGKEPVNSSDPFFDIGKEIVKKCVNVPLSIRVVGSMLYDQDESKWLSVKSANLMEIGEGEDGILPILKYSYYHLSSPLKSCFSYCALFPKDFKIKKELLIRLWLAQGCLDKPHDCRTQEDIGEEYFSILLQRCFFQDAEKDLCGEIESCKMHDLIHDLAQEVAGNETNISDLSKGQFDKRSRHLSLTTDGFYLLANNSTQMSEIKSLRTFLTATKEVCEINLYPSDYTATKQMLLKSVINSRVIAIGPHLRRLRALSLTNLKLVNLPDTLGTLLQLRYLDLSENMSLRALPNSITKLINLLVLNLDRTAIGELPHDMKKVVNLRHLSLHCSFNLRHMPPGLDTLTNLQMLSKFVVGDETHNQGNIGKLRDLKALVNLRDELTIRFDKNFSCDVAEYEEVELLRMTPLKHLNIDFWVEMESLIMAPLMPLNVESKDKGAAIHETMLGCLQPHCRLSTISIDGYRGFKLPMWTRSLTVSHPHLVSIHLTRFYCLEILPSLSQLIHLKYLKLEDISNVQFIPLDDQLTFFPSLEELQLSKLTKLKGWWREETSKVTGESRASSMVAPSFPCLHKLDLEDCPNLTAFPSCPKLKSARLSNCHRALTLFRRIAAPCNFTTRCVLHLEKLSLHNVQGLNCLFGDFLGSIHDLSIQDFNGETLSNFAAVLPIAASIEKLEIGFCYNLKHVSGFLEHFTHLQSLEIVRCLNLELGTVSPWRSLPLLSSLTLDALPKLFNLPEGFQYLTSLEYLEIWVDNLVELPEWLNCLTSLQTLMIKGCYKLKSLPEAIAHMPSLKTLDLFLAGEDLQKVCQEPDGEAWSKVCRIPNLLL